jgi:hypothetical protein
VDGEELGDVIDDIEEWRARRARSEARLVLHAATSILIAIVNSQRLRVKRLVDRLRAR